MAVLDKPRAAKAAPSVDLDAPRFTMKEVARASGGNINTVFSWFQRGHFQLGQTDRQAEAGTGHGISLRTALEVAIAVHLHRHCGLHPSAGVKVARKFTHFGDKNRAPGELYAGRDFTVLIVYPELEDGKVIQMIDGTPLIEAFSSRHGRQIAATVVWLNFIDKAVRVALLQGGKGSAE